MAFWPFLLVFLLALPRGHGEGFFSKFTNKGRNGNNKGNEYVDVCETVRIMPRIAMAVVGGTPLKVENSAPYIAAVGERTANGSVSWFCGGSLISPHHVLTAAHCLVSRNVSTVRVGSFSTKKRSTENDYEVSETIIHPEYKITQSYNDIGILRVKDRIALDSNIKPVCLPQGNENYEKERAKVIGWGAEEFGGEGTQKLQQVEVEVFSNSNCEKAYSNSTIAPKTFPKGIKNSQLCAGSKKGGKDACQGDSGGPLVLTDEQGIVRQIGIVSTGAGCGFKMYPGVYTRVSSYTDWIQQQIKGTGSAQSSQKDSSREVPSKKNEQPSRPNGASTEPPHQGTLLSAQSIYTGRNQTNGRPHHSSQTQNSREVYSGGNSQNGNQNNKLSGMNSFPNSGSNNRRPEQTQNSREVYSGGNSQNGNQNSKTSGMNSFTNSGSNNRRPEQNQNSREVYSGGNSQNGNQNSKVSGTNSFPNSGSNNRRPEQTQNSREVYSSSDFQIGKQNGKISGTNSFTNSVSNTRKPEQGSREVFSQEKGYRGNDDERGRGQNQFQNAQDQQNSAYLNNRRVN